MRRFFAVLTLIALSLGALSGCAGLVVGGAATGVAVAHDRRSAGTVIDDQTIETRVLNAIHADSNLDKNSHVNVTSYNYAVLLTGEVATEAFKGQVERMVSGTPQVKRVHNYLRVAPNSSLGARTDDTWITTKVKSNLLNMKIKGFDATRVKVVTEAKVVYLMGLLRRNEADATLARVRSVSGVERVVALFEYI